MTPIPDVDPLSSSFDHDTSYKAAASCFHRRIKSDLPGEELYDQLPQQQSACLPFDNVCREDWLLGIIYSLSATGCHNHVLRHWVFLCYSVLDEARSTCTLSTGVRGTVLLTLYLCAAISTCDRIKVDGPC